MAEKCASRLNMKHGFVQSIRRNQFDRDNYDKEVKKMEKCKRPINGRLSSDRIKKPDAVLYTPPNRAGTNIRAKQSKAIEKIPIFILTYDNQDGKEFDLCIYEDTDLQKESEDFAKKCGLCSVFVSPLHKKLQEFYEKYKNKD